MFLTLRNVKHILVNNRADKLHQPQIQAQVEAHFVSDVLRGHENTEMRVSLIRYIEDEMPPEDE